MLQRHLRPLTPTPPPPPPKKKKKKKDFWGIFPKCRTHPPLPPFWEPLFQKKSMVYCILGPLEHFWSSSKCSLFGNYYDIYFWEWVTPPSQRKKIQNFLLSPIFSEFSRFRIKSYVIKLIRYHLPTIVKHVLAPKNDFGIQKNTW